jgi:hypothetical protein
VYWFSEFLVLKQARFGPFFEGYLAARVKNVMQEKNAYGSLETKTTAVDETTTEQVVYEYNLQNRLAKVTTTPYVAGQPQTSSVTEYKYDPDGNRVSKTVDGIATN